MIYEEVREKIKLWTGADVSEGQYCGISSLRPVIWNRHVVNGPSYEIEIPKEFYEEWKQCFRDNEAYGPDWIPYCELTDRNNK